jgi:hypothetical protein
MGQKKKYDREKKYLYRYINLRIELDPALDEIEIAKWSEYFRIEARAAEIRLKKIRSVYNIASKSYCLID